MELGIQSQVLRGKKNSPKTMGTTSPRVGDLKILKELMANRAPGAGNYFLLSYDMFYPNNSAAKPLSSTHTNLSMNNIDA